MWGKAITVILLVGELLLRWLQSKDRQDGKEELLEEQRKANEDQVKKADDIRNSVLDDELLLKPKDRKPKLRIIQRDILDQQGRGEPDSDVSGHTD